MDFLWRGYAKMSEKVDLRSLNLEECLTFVKSLGWPSFRGKQIFSWVHQKGCSDFSAMTNLSKEQRIVLAEHAFLRTVTITDCQRSQKDETVKFLFSLADGQTIESVLMLFRQKDGHDRTTCCISSQTGCPLGCKFCGTGTLGAGRNLTVGELVGQVYAANQHCKEIGWPFLSNIVYMGMGEPLLNMTNVLKSLALFRHTEGQHLSGRHLTISTCGLVPQILALAEEENPPELAISLHAATDEKRSALMPVNRKYPLAELFAACSVYTNKTGRRITYEYAMFQGVNDSMEDAQQLISLLRGKLAHVNLIPANYLPQTGFYPSDSEMIKKFADKIEKSGLAVSIRYSRGQDIAAACGQLKAQKEQGR